MVKYIINIQRQFYLSSSQGVWTCLFSLPITANKILVTFPPKVLISLRTDTGVRMAFSWIRNLSWSQKFKFLIPGLILTSL